MEAEQEAEGERQRKYLKFRGKVRRAKKFKQIIEILMSSSCYDKDNKLCLLYQTAIRKCHCLIAVLSRETLGYFLHLLKRIINQLHKHVKSLLKEIT